MIIIQQIKMQQQEEEVRILPEHVLTFYRNEYQSAATITILRGNYKQSIYYELKSTNKHAYLVSSSRGEIREDKSTKYIDILINQEYPLEQCLMDRFKIVVRMKERSPLQKTFKVVINYKKDASRMKESNFTGIEVASRTSGSMSTAAHSTSILGHPLALNKKSILKQSKIATYLSKNDDKDRVNLKSSLEDIVREVQQKRMKLQHISQQTLKRSSRKKFGCYLMVIAIFCSFLMGLLFHKVTKVGIVEML